MTEEARGVPLVYVGAEDHPAVAATTFNIVNDPVNDEFTLTVGQVQLPLLLGTPEEQQEQLSHISYVGIRVLGRYTMTEPRVRALVEMLKGHLDRYDQQKGNRE